MADPVRPLVVIAGGETLACAGLTLVVGVGALRSDLDVWIAVATVVIWLVIAVGVSLIGFGLHRRRRAARSPFLLAQAFALVLAWPLVNSDVIVESGAGIVLGEAALVGLVVGLRPKVRESLA